MSVCATFEVPFAFDDTENWCLILRSVPKLFSSNMKIRLFLCLTVERLNNKYNYNNKVAMAEPTRFQHNFEFSRSRI